VGTAWARALLTALTPVSWICIAAWIAILVALPIVKGLWGQAAMRRGVTLGVIAQAASVLSILQPVWGWAWTAGIALGVVTMGWSVEFLGSRTGFPFGRYHYTGLLQPQLGRVPVIIPVAWLMMLPPSWAVARLIAGQGGVAFVVVSALAFTAWDLFLDPQMVGWELWLWDQPGQYCRRDRSGGIPWVNFAGWLLASGVMTALLWPAVARAGALPVAALSLVYGITWLLETVGLGIIWRQPRPAVAGFVGMGVVLVWAWARVG
jgi:uncharacterized membrane protein